MFPVSLLEDLHRCVNCGVCQQVCPTYRATRKESHAPRGRVQIVKHYLEGKLEAKHLHNVLSSCIQCDACAAFCLSGVRIDRVFSNITRELQEARKTPIKTKILGSILTSRAGLHTSAKAGRIAQGFGGVLGVPAKIGNIPLSRMPKFNRKSFRATTGEVVAPKGKRTGRIAYFTGCATELLFEDVGRSVLQLLQELRLEVIIPQEQVCCGMPFLSKGSWKQALPAIEKNLRLFDRDDIDAIVVDCGTCGVALKKRIPELLEDVGLNPEKAKRVAAKVKDITQVVHERLEELPLIELPSAINEGTKVTYHDPCHLSRGMGVVAEPRKILSALEGVEFVEMIEANQCCGGGGAFQFEEVEISADITSRKLSNLRETEARIVVTGCPGCHVTLAGNLSGEDTTEVLHTAQLVARCLSGRKPAMHRGGQAADTREVT